MFSLPSIRATFAGILLGAGWLAMGQGDPGHVATESPYVPKDPRIQPFLEVSFKPELDVQVPLDLEFMGDDGKRAPLRDRMLPGKPAILALVYYRCPTMCNLMLNGMVEALRDVSYLPGKDFSVLAVSFDARETHVVAAGKLENALEMYGKPETAGAWHFLVGQSPQIDKLTASVHFGFKYDSAIDQFAHGSGLLILTPDGKLSRFLPGVLYPRRDLQLALVEAGQGKIGTLTDKLALLCYHYDPKTGKYGLVINRVIQIACFATVAAMAALILGLLRQERRAKAAAAAHTP
jgi:protein SCO1/2